MIELYREKKKDFLFYARSAIELMFLSLFIISVSFFPSSIQARVSGNCSNCHTMHNSQQGSAMSFDGFTHEYLLRGTCLGCHSSTVASTWQNSLTGAPIVFNTSEPTYGTKGLAAGNFYWVQTDDANGHNALASNPESTLTEAPGRAVGCIGNNSCHVNIHGSALASDFDDFDRTRQGCTKCHIVGNNLPKGYHHKNDTGPLIDSAAEGWYRFLAGHDTGATHGVEGIEDDDWEQETSTDHNEYLGYNDNSRTIPIILASFGGTHTMTAYCCGCHGNFHRQDSTAAGASPWLRHPADLVIPDSSEYTVAFNASSGVGTYDSLVPVARPSLGGWTESSNTVNLDVDMVMCLSCHRAHASPYFKMMRWDYRGWPGSGGPNYCAMCHTSKQ